MCNRFAESRAVSRPETPLQESGPTRFAQTAGPIKNFNSQQHQRFTTSAPATRAPSDSGDNYRPASASSNNKPSSYRGGYSGGGGGRGEGRGEGSWR